MMSLWWNSKNGLSSCHMFWYHTQRLSKWTEAIPTSIPYISYNMYRLKCLLRYNLWLMLVSSKRWWILVKSRTIGITCWKIFLHIQLEQCQRHLYPWRCMATELWSWNSNWHDLVGPKNPIFQLDSLEGWCTYICPMISSQSSGDEGQAFNESYMSFHFQPDLSPWLSNAGLNLSSDLRSFCFCWLNVPLCLKSAGHKKSYILLGVKPSKE